MSKASQKKKKLIEIEIGIDLFLELSFIFFPFLAIIRILEVAVISIGRRNQ